MCIHVYKSVLTQISLSLQIEVKWNEVIFCSCLPRLTVAGAVCAVLTLSLSQTVSLPLSSQFFFSIHHQTNPSRGYSLKYLSVFKAIVTA